MRSASLATIVGILALLGAANRADAAYTKTLNVSISINPSNEFALDGSCTWQAADSDVASPEVTVGKLPTNRGVDATTQLLMAVHGCLGHAFEGPLVEAGSWSLACAAGLSSSCPTREETALIKEADRECQWAGGVHTLNPGTYTVKVKEFMSDGQEAIDDPKQFTLTATSPPPGGSG